MVPKKVKSGLRSLFRRPTASGLPEDTATADDVEKGESEDAQLALDKIPGVVKRTKERTNRKLDYEDPSKEQNCLEENEMVGEFSEKREEEAPEMKTKNKAKIRGKKGMTPRNEGAKNNKPTDPSSDDGVRKAQRKVVQMCEKEEQDSVESPFKAMLLYYEAHAERYTGLYGTQRSPLMKGMEAAYTKAGGKKSEAIGKWKYMYQCLELNQIPGEVSSSNCFGLWNSTATMHTKIKISEMCMEKLKTHDYDTILTWLRRCVPQHFGVHILGALYSNCAVIKLGRNEDETFFTLFNRSEEPVLLSCGSSSLKYFSYPDTIAVSLIVK